MLGISRYNIHIILSYGFFLGWLLSFPYSGPVLKLLVLNKAINTSELSLIFICAPVLFLVVFSMLIKKENGHKVLMTVSNIICIAGTLLIIFSSYKLWHIIFAAMGISCVIFIPAWSYYFTNYVNDNDKLRTMALVIIIGNVIYFIINNLINVLLINGILAILTIILFISLVFSYKISNQKKKTMTIQSTANPKRLLLAVYAFIFLINLNGGIMFQAIDPYFKLYENISQYYLIIPYILIMIIYFMSAHKIPKMLPVYVGTVSLGLAYVSFSTFGITLKGYFTTVTLAQAGWAIMDLFLWTLLGEIASVYGRPLRICSYGLSANLSAVFIGGLIGLKFYYSSAKNQYLTGLFSIAIIFIAILVIPFLNKMIVAYMKDLPDQEAKSSAAEKASPNSVLLPIPGFDSLTAREKEIAELLIRDMTIKDISKSLSISENTMKIHARHIYSKTGVANKKELIKITYSKPNNP